LSSFAKLGICALITGLVWMVPTPEGLTTEGIRIFAVFLGVITSFILRPFPMGAMVVLGLMVLAASGTIGIKEALSGYGDSTVWLVVAAFLIAGGVIRTGLGRRIALIFVSKMGKTSIGLGYSLCLSELLLGPVVPSNTARGGGILAPIVQSISNALKSDPAESPERAGAYLTLVGAHANLITAAMFLTGMAANPLVAKAASTVMNIDFGWGTWALGAIVPGLIGLALLPLVLSRISKPTLSDTSAAQHSANEELTQMGTWSRGEKIMTVVFVVLIALWTTKPLHGIHTTTVAWIGVLILIFSNTEKWDDIIGNTKAWDTLIWLGGLLTMANMLKEYSFISWFADNVGAFVQSTEGLTLVILIGLIYFYSMYLFSMLTAHIAAMASIFLALSVTAGAPAMVTVAIIAYFSNLCACLTYYSTGPVVIYFGAGYVGPQKWFKAGFLISLFHLAIWLGPGLLWWKVLGWW
jgi:DASS family divalent anion:Na+ symporter